MDFKFKTKSFNSWTEWSYHPTVHGASTEDKWRHGISYSMTAPNLGC